MHGQQNQKILKHLRLWNIAFIIFLVGISAFLLYYYLAPEWIKEEHIINSKTNGTFKIRILEEPKFFMQFRYRVQTAPADSAYWKTIYSVTHNDLHSSRILPIDFIGEEIGYFAFGEIYAITKDKGKTWKLFNFSKQTDWGRDNGYYAPIEDVKINEKGVGTIILRKSKTSQNLPKFITNDFGLTWKERF